MEKGFQTKKKGISVSLTEDTIEGLDQFCKKNFNAERSAVIEEAIKKFLELKK